jgi:hypothetical protein
MSDVLRGSRDRHTPDMSGTHSDHITSRAVQCERHDACERPDSHRGKCDLRMCASEGCPNPARNSDERFCSRHEDRATYERYWTATGEADRLRGTEEKAEG